MKNLPYVGISAFFGTWVLCRNFRSEESIAQDNAKTEAIINAIKEKALEEEVAKITMQSFKQISVDKENSTNES